MRQLSVIALCFLSIVFTPSSSALQSSPNSPSNRPQVTISVEGEPLPPREVGEIAKSGVATPLEVGMMKFGLWPEPENSEITLAIDDASNAVAVAIFAWNMKKGKKNRELEICQIVSVESENPLRLDLKNRLCVGGKGITHGGFLALTDGKKYLPIIYLTDIKDVRFGGDLGIALNVLNRSGDGKGARYFDGASFYYSLTGLGLRDRFHLIANLSTLDFDEEGEENGVDFEVGIGLGILYRVNPKAKPDDGSFTISATYGYNLMTDSGEDGEYLIVGFGWSFGRKK